VLVLSRLTSTRSRWHTGDHRALLLLIGVFRFVALQAVILNKALSLVVVITALPARLLGVPYGSVADHRTVIVNLLTGSL